MSTSKTGKHGHAKVNLVAIDVSLVSLLVWLTRNAWRVVLVLLLE
jgi:hypothetical protein